MFDSQPYLVRLSFDFPSKFVEESSLMHRTKRVENAICIPAEYKLIPTSDSSGIGISKNTALENLLHLEICQHGHFTRNR